MTGEHPKRVLMICYAFPPTGGGGVQRSVKFVKYLPDNGWQPTVLTAANPSVPVRDQDLAGDVKSSVKVIRARTLEPSYSSKQKLAPSASKSRFSVKRFIRSAAMSVLQPDPQVLWNPFAYRAASAELNQADYDVIYATGPPYSSFLLGQRLKRKYGIPLVVDFRDEWLIAIEYLENHRRSALSSRIQTKMMHRILQSADAILATTQASADQLGVYASRVGSAAKVHCIYNGYDESDFAETSCDVGIRDDTALNATGCANQDSSRLRIVYTGTLWELTDISPVVESLRKLIASNPTIAAKIQLSIAGRLAPKQQAIVDGLRNSPIEVQCLGYLPHNECITLARSADLLLLLLADRPGAERVVPAKLFEYLALQRRVLAVCGEGETEMLLRQRSQVVRFHPDDRDAIADYLQACVADPKMHMPVPNPSPNELETFSRRRLTQQLASVMQELSR